MNPRAEGAAEQDLLSRWMDEATVGGTTPVAVGRSGPLLASPAQRGLWMAQQIAGDDSTSLVMHHAHRIRGPLDVAALARALDVVVARHEALRTGFRWTGGDLVQHVNEPRELHVAAEPLSSRHPHIETAIRETIATAAIGAMDLGAGRVFHPRLYRIGHDDHVQLLLIHHIANDGWSMTVMNRDIAALYDEYTGGPAACLSEIELQYCDFAAWQRDSLAGGAHDECRTFWKHVLAGVRQPTPLPLDRARPPVQSLRGGWLEFPVTGGVMSRVVGAAAALDATPFMVTLAAFFLALSRWTGESDLVVAGAVSVRPFSEVENTVGPFVTLLPLRCGVSASGTFADLVGVVRSVVLDARVNEMLPFEDILAAVDIPKNPSYSPLSQVVFSHHAGLIEDLELTGVTVTRVPLADVDIQKDLQFQLADGVSPVIVIGYATALFDEATVRKLAEQYVEALAHLVDRPGAPLSELALPGAMPAPRAAWVTAVSQSAVDVGNGVESNRDLVARAWREVLGTNDFTATDDFFDLGGESLGAIRVCTRLSEWTGVAVTMRLLYENPNFGSFVRRVDAVASQPTTEL